ncbi:MAG: DNA polymerase III subunit beta [Candidatus Binatus sp.]|uniref:DNA polymerase III subunit beta n=1 Tax=Candidatus Binatus sp. TaxID=2811406 RepID=UPI002724AA39|nr:DNA polymerase III subunit beta [Candidatus Binatus sp.]MDO8431945.1 DNA polymerase III subunit beta [Candidatus Binatus sp.]
MGLSIARTSLLGGLGLVQGIVERRTTVPILGHVLIEPNGNGLNLSATDLEVGIRTNVACSGKEKSLTLNARKLFEIVREAEGEEVALTTLDNDWVELKCGRAKFKMMGLDPRSFPAMPSQSVGKEADGAKKKLKAELVIPATVLKDMIDKTLFAVSPDEARYNLSGVFVESSAPGSARMVATDGHRLAMIEREVAGFSMDGGAIIPRKGLAELRKILDQDGDTEVRLSLEGQLAYLKRGNTEVSMRLVEGEFPDYRGVIPKQSKYKIAVPRDALFAAIKRAAIFSSERYHGVKFSLSPGLLTVSSTSPETGEASESLDVDFNNEDFAIGFNASYVSQVLGVIPAGANVELGLSDDVSPGVIRAPEADSQYTYVVMPMRL